MIHLVTVQYKVLHAARGETQAATALTSTIAGWHCTKSTPVGTQSKLLSGTHLATEVVLRCCACHVEECHHAAVYVVVEVAVEQPCARVVCVGIHSDHAAGQDSHLQGSSAAQRVVTTWSHFSEGMLMVLQHTCNRRARLQPSISAKPTSARLWFAHSWYCWGS